MRDLRPHQQALLFAGLITVIGWAVPVLGQLLLPLQYLNTHIHELCHAVVGIASGADVHEIIVRGDGSGVTPLSGGALVLVGSAGYVGAAIVGALIIVAAKTESGARMALRVLGCVLLLGLLIWVRGDAVGIFTAAFWAGALVALSFLKGNWLLFATQFIGLQQCAAALRSIYVLLQISAIGEGHSDASLLEEYTHVPAIVWSLGWSALSVTLLYLALRQAWPHATSTRK